MTERRIILNKNYTPLPCHVGDEIYPNGIFHFNISRIIEQINDGILDVKKEQINVDKWFNTHFHGSVNEAHLRIVDVTKPILQAEIRPGMFEIIDGNHRIEKAYREGIPFINSYKIKGEQLLPYFIDLHGYEAFVEYWNSKL